MNTLLRDLASQNAVRITLGEGEPGLMSLLGGFGAAGSSVTLQPGLGGLKGGYSRIARIKADSRSSGGSSGSGSGGRGGGGGGDDGGGGPIP